MKNELRKVVLENETLAGKVFDLFIQFLIFVSLLSFSLETIPNKSAYYYSILTYVEVITVSLFTIEYILRLTLVEKKIKFIVSFYGIIDLLAILPFYITAGLDLRALRAFRLLRLFKFFRYSKVIRRLNVALKLAKQELILFFTLTCILLYLAAVGIYYCENDIQPIKFSSIIDSLWWAVATLTTVGYGDVYPITAGGKLFTFFVLMIGLGIVSIPAGIIASAVSKAREIEDND